MNNQAYEHMVGMVLSKTAAPNLKLLQPAFNKAVRWFGNMYDKFIPQGGLLGRKSNRDLNKQIRKQIDDHKLAIKNDRQSKTKMVDSFESAGHYSDLDASQSVVNSLHNFNLKSSPGYNLMPKGTPYQHNGTTMMRFNQNAKLDTTMFDMLMRGAREDLSRYPNRQRYLAPYIQAGQARLDAALQRNLTEDIARKAIAQRNASKFFHNVVKPVAVTTLGAAGVKEIADRLIENE